MSKVLLAVNTLTSVNSFAYASHLNLAYRIGRDHPEDELVLFSAVRVSIDNFRNQAAKYALQGEFDYLLFLDDDVLIPRDTYGKLKARDVDVVTPLTYIRTYPYKPMFFKSIGLGEDIGLTHYDDWKEHIIEGGLVEAAAIGFSCCLIKVSLLKKVPPAWFVTGSNHTEDVFFCIKARQCLNNKVGIFVDTDIQAGHLLEPEYVSYDTRDNLMEFYEKFNPEIKEHAAKVDRHRGDHDGDYLERNMKIVSALPIMDAKLQAARSDENPILLEREI